MGDLIDRQAAIELTMQYCPDDDGTCSKADEDICNLLDELEALPSTELERKKGKWIIDNDTNTGWDKIICSECGEEITSIAPIINTVVAPIIGFSPKYKVIWGFCLWCGTRMKEDEEYD